MHNFFLVVRRVFFYRICWKVEKTHKHTRSAKSRVRQRRGEKDQHHAIDTRYLGHFRTYGVLALEPFKCTLMLKKDEELHQIIKHYDKNKKTALQDKERQNPVQCLLV